MSIINKLLFLKIIVLIHLCQYYKIYNESKKSKHCALTIYNISRNTPSNQKMKKIPVIELHILLISKAVYL